MKILTVRAALAAIVVLHGTAGLGSAASAPIGTVTSSGTFRLNGDTVLSNGTVLDGAVLETVGVASSVQLSSGTRFALGPASRGKLYGDRMILEKGAARLENGAGFHLEALGLIVRPERGSAIGQIGLEGSAYLRVAAQTGAFQVLNARGLLVAHVAAGSALAFEPQAPTAAAATRVAGTLSEQGGHFLLTDRITQVTMELTGRGLEAQVGRVVQVGGQLNASATPVDGASQVIAAIDVQTVATGAGTEGAAIVGGVASAVTREELPAGGLSPAAYHAAQEGQGPPPGPPGKPPERPPVTPPETPPGRPPGRPPVSPPGLSR